MNYTVSLLLKAMIVPTFIALPIIIGWLIEDVIPLFKEVRNELARR